MEKENNIIKKTSKIIGTIITIIVVFLASIIIVQKFSNNQMSVLGFRIFVVQTGSMIPKYNIGDVILVKTKSIDSIKVGDDISYLGEERDYDGKVVTHQVVNVDNIKINYHPMGQKKEHCNLIKEHLKKRDMNLVFRLQSLDI